MAFVGFFLSRYLAAYQLGHIPYPWDPFFGDGTQRVLDWRRDRILVDIHRNDPGATLVGAYSVRERRGAPVSMPIEWAEVERDISPEDFHIRNARERVRTIGDPFADFFRSPQKLELPSDAKPRRRTRGSGEGRPTR